MGKHSYSRKELKVLRRAAKKYQPAHATVMPKNIFLRVSSVILSLMLAVMVSFSTVAYYAVNKVSENIVSVDLVSTFDPVFEVSRVDREALDGLFDSEPELVELGSFDGAFNVLIVGNDTRVGQGDRFGASRGELNDVNILLSVNESHTQAVVISLPRDLIVEIPSCVREDGRTLSARVGALNSVLGSGGLPCVARTVETLMGVPIMYAGMLTFTGVAEISTTIGGVPVCVSGPLKDRYSGLDLPEAGVYELEGFEALAFLRTRYNVGDGSDLSRIGLQQLYLSSMLRKIVEEGTLNDLGKLYTIALSVSNNAVLSSSLANVDKMVAMARTFTDIPLENVVFVMFPVSGGGEAYPGKVVPREPVASKLVELVANGEMFQLGDTASGRGTSFTGDEDSRTFFEGLTTLTGVVGQSASDLTCTNPR